VGFVVEPIVGAEVTGGGVGFLVGPGVGSGVVIVKHEPLTHSQPAVFLQMFAFKFAQLWAFAVPVRIDRRMTAIFMLITMRRCFT
jgi:hypothetical protein